MNTVTIASIYFLPLDATRPFQVIGGTGWNTVFHIDACDLGECKTTKVYDMVQDEYVLDGRHTRNTDSTTAMQVAVDLVKFWSDPGIGGEFGGPGVWVCKGDEPSPEEIAYHQKRQEGMCNFYIQQAENYWIEGKRDKVGDIHRACARWMRKMDVKWYKPLQAVSLVACKACGEQIQEGVMRCHSCGSIADFEAYKQYLILQKQAEAEVIAKLGGLPSVASPVMAPAPAVAPAPAAVALAEEGDELPPVTPRMTDFSGVDFTKMSAKKK